MIWRLKRVRMTCRFEFELELVGCCLKSSIKGDFRAFWGIVELAWNILFSQNVSWSIVAFDPWALLGDLRAAEVKQLEYVFLSMSTC